MLASRLLPLVTAALSLAVPAAAQRALSGSRPNIVFVFSDDHACHAISAYGSRVNETPNIDRVAQEGVLFRNNFCGNSLCGPSRATVLTGLHSHANGFMRNGNVFDGDQTTFPKLLQKVGYQTAIVGKWHLSSDPQGFDHWVVLPGQGQYYNPDFRTRDGRVRIEGHATDVTTRLALDWLEQRDPDRPFLLMCQHKAPHRNWQPAEQDLALFRGEDVPEPPTLFDDHAGRGPMLRAQEMEVGRHLFLHYDLLLPPDDPSALRGTDRAWLSQRERMTPAQLAAWDAAFAAENEAFLREDPQGDERVRWYYQRYIKNYLRCVAGVDRSVGELLAWLDAHPDVKANTIVIYSSDQGFYLGDHGFYDKRWMYEESLKMPLVVSWPGRIEPGREVAELTQNIDFAPTFLDLAGVPVPEAMHGESLVPLLEGAPERWRDAIYYHYYESQAVHMVPAMYGVRTERYKLVRYYEPQWDAWELFDLDEDPDELRSVADDPRYAEIRAELQRRLAELRRTYGDDTGAVGDGAFPVLAGIARVVPLGDGYRVWANAPGGYLLRTGSRPGRTTLRTTLAPYRVDGAPAHARENGFVVVTGGDPRRRLVRAGVEFAAGRLVLVGPDGLGVVAEAPLDWSGRDRLAPVALRVDVDLEGQTITAEALGRRVTAPLPAGWTALSAWGYGADNAESTFGPLTIEGS